MNPKQIFRSIIVIITFLIAIYGNRILANHVTISIASDYLSVS